MLGRHFISLNGESIPNPDKLSISDNNIETVKLSEAGTDVGTVTLLCKRTFNFTFTSTSRGRDKIKHFCKMAQCNMTFDGETMTGRLRIKSENMVENSEYCDRTNGLWSLSVSFMERGD